MGGSLSCFDNPLVSIKANVGNIAMHSVFVIFDILNLLGMKQNLYTT